MSNVEIVYSVSTRAKGEHEDLKYGKVLGSFMGDEIAYVISNRNDEVVHLDDDAIDALIVALIQAKTKMRKDRRLRISNSSTVS